MLGALFMRHLDTNGDVYLPYSFSGNWSEDEKKLISDAISPYVPEKVDATWNNWQFTKFDRGFLGRRFTWDRGFFNTETVEELAQKIAAYYNRYYNK